jgi:hypothetical protein
VPLYSSVLPMIDVLIRIRTSYFSPAVNIYLLGETSRSRCENTTTCLRGDHHDEEAVDRNYLGPVFIRRY